MNADTPVVSASAGLGVSVVRARWRRAEEIAVTDGDD
jgi:hypothetical protein